jgi:hypothetical protein
MVFSQPNAAKISHVSFAACHRPCQPLCIAQILDRPDSRCLQMRVHAPAYAPDFPDPDGGQMSDFNGVISVGS